MYESNSNQETRSESFKSSIPSSLLSSIVEEEKEVESIPCLYLPYDDGARKIVIYFHGNAEDIGLAFDLLY